MGRTDRQSWRWAQVDWGDDAYRSARSDLVGYLDEVRADTTRWRAGLATGNAAAPDTAAVGQAIAGLVGKHSTLRERFEGDAAELQRMLGQLTEAWPRVAAAQRLAEDIAIRCARITLPVWANRELAEMSTGQMLDFRSEFGDDLPDVRSRQRLLTDLAARSRSVSAYIDPDRETLYCTPSGRIPELAYTVAPFVALVVCGVIAAEIGNLHSWWSSGLTDSFASQWNDSGTLVSGYMAAAIGAIAHLYVDWYKARRLVATGQQIVVPRRVRQRIEIHACQLCASAATVLAVALGWIWIANRTDAATMILVGYSADSLLGAFVARFSAFASSDSTALVRLAA